MSATDMEILSSPMPIPKIDDYSYALGFSKGYEAADSSTVCWAFGMCAVLVIIGCFIVLYHHLSRQNDILSRFRVPDKNRESGNVFSLLLPLAFTVCLAGCAGKQGEVVNPAPVSPEVVNAPAPADRADKGMKSCRTKRSYIPKRIRVFSIPKVRLMCGAAKSMSAIRPSGRISINSIPIRNLLR